MRPAPESHLFSNVISLLFYVRFLSSYSFVFYSLYTTRELGLSVAAAAAVTPFFASQPQQQVRIVPSEPKTLVIVGSTPSIVLLPYIVRARPAHPPHVVSGRRHSVSFYCSTMTHASEQLRAFESVVCFLPLSLFFDFVFRSIVSFFNIFQSLPLPKLRCC